MAVMAYKRPAPGQLAELYSTTGSLQGLAQKLGVSVTTAYRWAQEAGVTLRPRGTRPSRVPAAPRHGTASRYRRKCRCRACITAHSEALTRRERSQRATRLLRAAGIDPAIHDHDEPGNPIRANCPLACLAAVMHGHAFKALCHAQPKTSGHTVALYVKRHTDIAGLGPHRAAHIGRVFAAAGLLPATSPAEIAYPPPGQASDDRTKPCHGR